MIFLICRTGKIRLKSDDEKTGKAPSKTKRWTKLERNVLLKFKRIHLLQQSHERKILSQNILDAMKDGQIICIILLIINSNNFNNCCF